MLRKSFIFFSCIGFMLSANGNERNEALKRLEKYDSEMVAGKVMLEKRTETDYEFNYDSNPVQAIAYTSYQSSKEIILKREGDYVLRYRESLESKNNG